MDIGELTARQKSVLLAKLMGWTVEVWATGDYGKRGEYHKAYWTKTDGRVLDSDVVGFSEQEAIEGQVINFYAEANMAEAWRVLNWAMAVNGPIQKVMTIYDPAMPMLPQMPPAKAQAAWLDKILSMAIEANLITLEQANGPL